VLSPCVPRRRGGSTRVAAERERGVLTEPVELSNGSSPADGASDDNISVRDPSQ